MSFRRYRGVTLQPQIPPILVAPPRETGSNVGIMSNMKDGLVEAVLSAAAFTGASKFIFKGEKISMKNSLVVAACVFLADMLNPYIRNFIPQSLQNSKEMIVDPLVVGVVYYVVSTYILKNDNRSLLKKVLHAAGSNAVGKYIEKPVRGIIGI